MLFPHRRGLIPRLREYLRYQSRFGHERIKLTLGFGAMVATAAGIAYLFTH